MGYALVAALLIAFGLHLVVHRQARRRDEELAKMLRRVDAAMSVWVTHWGEPADKVKPILVAALRQAEISPRRRRTDV